MNCNICLDDSFFQEKALYYLEHYNIPINISKQILKILYTSLEDCGLDCCTTDYISGLGLIEFQDEGNPLNGDGLIEAINFVGNGVTATRSGNSIIITVNTNLASILANGTYGDIIVSNGSLIWTIGNSAVTTEKINNNAVTFAKMTKATSGGKLIGSNGASINAVNFQEISLGAGLTMDGTVLKLGTNQYWGLNGNSISDLNYIGTNNNKDVLFKRNNQLIGKLNTVSVNWGLESLESATGVQNVALGHYSLKNNTTASYNTAVGHSALYNNTFNGYNTGIGYSALFTNTGQNNTGIGASVLWNNATGNFNTALGFEAGYSNIAGSQNIFLGFKAGYHETTSNKLYISTSAGTDALNGKDSKAIIYGEMSTAGGTSQVLYFNASVIRLKYLVPQNYANDAAAADLGIPVGGLYHTNGTLKIRLS